MQSVVGLLTAHLFTCHCKLHRLLSGSGFVGKCQLLKETSSQLSVKCMVPAVSLQLLEGLLHM